MFYLKVLEITSLYTILVLGVYLMTGLTGLFSLGQGGFVSIGAYTAAIAFLRFGFHRYPDPAPGVPLDSGLNNATFGRGYVLVRVTYDPDPPYEPDDDQQQNQQDGLDAHPPHREKRFMAHQESSFDGNHGVFKPVWA